MKTEKTDPAEWRPARTYKVGDEVTVIGKDGKPKRVRITEVHPAKPQPARRRRGRSVSCIVLPLLLLSGCAARLAEAPTQTSTPSSARISLDAKATPFSSYDAPMIASVQQRWYDLLDSSQFAQRAGRVVLDFRLTYDGRVTDLKVQRNEVGEILSLLCQRALLDPAPYARWPDDMHRMIGANYRDVSCTFYYPARRAERKAQSQAEYDAKRKADGAKLRQVHLDLAAAFGEPFVGMTEEEALAAFGKPQSKYVTVAEVAP